MAVAVVGLVMFIRMIAKIVSVVKIGQPTLGRSDNPGSRWKNLVVETLGHTRMLQLKPIGVLHWLVMIGFIGLVLTLGQAIGQLFNPAFALPLIGHFPPYEWFTEILGWFTVIAILGLMAVRFFGVGPQKGRFFGSRTWQAVFVELVILTVGICILVLRGLEYRLFETAGPAEYATTTHFPLTWFLIPGGLSQATLETAIVLVAALKIIISFTWMIVLGLNATMGVAWHR
ncbi:MAG: Fe-S oxidoreductase, partial [Propionibacterium sp.]|nr:Fe-S oxidoreductase [Propionibacterium sp.]